MNISELSVKRPTLIVVIFTLLLFLGLMGMRSLNQELIPQWTSPNFTVVTVYPGAAPSEVENGVTKVIERALVGISNVDVVRSISEQGVSLVIVSLKTGAELDPVLNDALRSIQDIKSELPALAQDPSVIQKDIGAGAVLTIGVESNKSASELYDLLEYRILPRFTKIQGVSDVDLIGATPREIQVNVNHQKLDNYGISILQVVQAIHYANIDFPAGNIENASGQTSLRMSGKFLSIPEMSELVVAQKPDGSTVKLKDIAEVLDTEKQPETLYRINGKQAIGIDINKVKDANTVLVTDGIKKEIKMLEKEYKDIQLKFSIPYDGSVMVKDATNGVLRDLIYAIVLVTAIMLLFLHSGRNALIVMITVPLSLISTFIGFSLFDYTLNLMTLLALSLIIGTLVDDAIVVLENVYRHLEMGKSRWQATLDGVKEVGMTVISTSAVLIVVFLPVALTKSVISPIIKPFSMVVVVAVIVSTFSALTLVPLLTSRFSKLEVSGGKGLWTKIYTGFENGIKIFSDFVQKVLIWGLRRPVWTLLIATVLFISSLALIPTGFIGAEFYNAGDQGEGFINIEYPQNYTLKQNNLASRQIEEYISQKPEVTGVYSSVGKTAGIFVIQEGSNNTQLRVKLEDKKKREISSILYFKQLENELNSVFTDVKVRSGVISLLGSASDAPVQVVLMGDNQDTLMAFAEDFVKEVRMIPGTDNVKLSIEGGLPQLLIRFDKVKMARLGINPETAAATIQTSFSGNTDSKFQQGEFDYDINIRLDAFNRQSEDDVRNLTVLNQLGQPVKLEQFCDITETTGSSRLERYNRMSSVILQSQVIGRATGDVGTEILALLASKDLPKGMDYTTESEMKYMNDAFGSLFMALFIAIVLVYLVMVALYESYLHPFVVMFSIPLSIIGALYALALTQNTLSIFTLLGMIVLVGLVTKNAILVVDFINTLRKDGVSMMRAIVKGTQLRIRPILMTAISTIVGMLPIAVSQGAGSEWKNGMGWALVGGMATSMLLSLIVVPVVYLIAEKTKNRLQRVFKS